MDQYPRVNFRIDKPFDELTPEEAKINFKWFLDVIPERVSTLRNVVHETHPKWEADYSRASLRVLSKWVKANVSMRKVTEQENEELIKQRSMTDFQANFMRERNEKLSYGSERIRFDVGIYLGEMLRKNVQNLEWQYEKRKQMASKGSPVLGLTKDASIKYHPMEVLQISKVVAAKLAKDEIKEVEEAYIRVYDIWFKKRLKSLWQEKYGY